MEVLKVVDMVIKNFPLTHYGFLKTLKSIYVENGLGFYLILIRLLSINSFFCIVPERKELISSVFFFICYMLLFLTKKFKKGV